MEHAVACALISHAYFASRRGVGGRKAPELCGLLEQGVLAVLGSQQPDTALLVRHACARHQVPHVYLHRGEGEGEEHALPQNTLSLTVTPSAEELGRALCDLVKVQGWKHFTVIYEKPDAYRNAAAYVALRFIHLGSTEYHVSAYTAVSDDTCIGVIRGVDVVIDERQLAVMIVNQRNPKAMEVHRIKETKDRLTFVINVELSAIVMMSAQHLQRKCVAGVLPTILQTITNASRHVPCAGEGGPHLTADKSCQHQFQVPCLVRRRRRGVKDAKKRRQRQEGLTSRDSSMAPTSRMRSPSQAVEKSRSRSRGRSRSEKRTHKWRSHSKGRSHSGLRFQEAPKTWADRAKASPAQQPVQVTHAALQEQKEDPRIAFLLQENASLKVQLQQNRVEFEALKNTAHTLVRSSSVEAAAG
ncbi:hypothetical protein HPB51_016844 [Rhipicephalus microplus]|uniref:Receptor ligand binding region domain-containing protein n=1 Tax=Rhipicephalus microplus TaxID=6941 RepID=A0A9J6DHV2_RHIMP|nr:hypothetical protein HPB51_016844 [Rhipicephalus microplus]